MIENWAPAEVEEAASRGVRPAAGRPLTLMYSGNYGVAHDLSPLLDRLRALAPGSPVRLILQVSGRRVPELRRATADLPVAVEWRDPVPLSGLAVSLCEADVHVVSVRAGFERLVVPSKAYAPMALGLSVLWLQGGASRSGAPALEDAVGSGRIPPHIFDGLDLRHVPRGPGRLSRSRRLREWTALLPEEARNSSEPGRGR